MTKIVRKNLPNAISVADVTDAVVRQKFMLANQNISALMGQLAEVQKAIVELQRKGVVSTGGGSATDVKMVVDATLIGKNIQEGAEPNVQSDWTQTDTTADDYIKNKPEIPQPAEQVNSDWNATSGAARILNKPSMMKNPYGLTLMPIDANGTPGAAVQYDGGSAKELSVLTAHQDISNKITYPNGGSNGNVLMKDVNGVKWGTVSTTVPVVVQAFTETTSEQVLPNQSQTLNVYIGKTGYKPVMIGHVCCLGTNASYARWARACYTCSEFSLSNTYASLTIDAASNGAVAQNVKVSFVVIYTKN